MLAFPVEHGQPQHLTNCFWHCWHWSCSVSWSLCLWDCHHCWFVGFNHYLYYGLFPALFKCYSLLLSFRQLYSSLLIFCLLVCLLWDCFPFTSGTIRWYFLSTKITPLVAFYCYLLCILSVIWISNYVYVQVYVYIYTFMVCTDGISKYMCVHVPLAANILVCHGIYSQC